MSYKDLVSYYDIIKEIVPVGYYKGKVLHVHDGDTIWVSITRPSNVNSIPQSFNKDRIDAQYDSSDEKIRIKVRFIFIDAPRLKDKVKKKEVGKLARNFVKKLIDQKDIYFKIFGLGKYFRHIGELYLEQDDVKEFVSEDTIKVLGGVDNRVSLNDLMVKTGYAVRKKY